MFRNGEIMIIAKDGFAYRVGAIKRRPADDRWNPGWLKAIKGTPAEPSRRSKDGDVMPYVRHELED